MGHMKKYRCPVCAVTDNVVGFGRRKKVLRYFCKACHKHFSVDPCFLDTKTILSDHLDGLSFRDLSRRYHLSPMKAWRICEEELKKLPNNNQFTFNYCSLFSNTFVFDGKYFNLAGKDHDWVFLWGITFVMIFPSFWWLRPRVTNHGANSSSIFVSLITTRS